MQAMRQGRSPDGQRWLVEGKESMERFNLKQARKYGVALIVASAGVGMFVSEFQRIRALPPSIENYGYLACFIMVAVLIFAWIWVTEYELGLDAWLYPKRKRIPSGTKETAQIMLLGVALVALFYSARSPMFLSVAVAAYSTIVCLLVFRMNTLELPPLFSESREHLTQNPEGWSDDVVKLRLDAVLVLESYFLRRPHTPRHVIILNVAFLGCLAALCARLKGSPEWALVSYGITFVTILVSEIVIFAWRIDRDNKLRPIDEKLRDLGHDIEKLANKPSEGTR